LNTTSNDPTMHSAISPPPNAVNKSPDVLLLRCLLDGEAYAAGGRRRKKTETNLAAPVAMAMAGNSRRGAGGGAVTVSGVV
jgi:hypothetical protein